MTAPIQITEQVGVCSVREDTRRLAELAGGSPPGRALDLGTGSGYIAIWLAQRGWEVVATDISPRALALAEQNAAANDADVQFIESNLFSAVAGRYDAIAFNPPMRADETELTRLLTSLLRRSSHISGLLMRLTHNRLGQQRLPFLADFTRQAEQHLNADGRLLLVISPDEAEALAANLDAWELAAFTLFETIPHAGVADLRWEG